MTSEPSPHCHQASSSDAARLAGKEIPVRRRYMTNRIFVIFCVCVAVLSIALLAVLLTSIAYQGIEHLNWQFLQNVPSRRAASAGVKPAMWGTIWSCLICAATAVPLGVGTAVLLEEFKPKNPKLQKLHSIVQLNITNLAGVPSIVYGILGLTAFVDMFGIFGNSLAPSMEFGTPHDWWYVRLPFGRSVLAGGMTLMLVVLPVVIVSTQEALRAIPNSLRNGALALGSTRWQMVWTTTLPVAIPGIMTGTILALSRAIGEAAPILVIAGTVYITFTPSHMMDDFTVMPLQIYNWAGRPQEAFQAVAASGIIVLLAVLLSFNALAIFIRQKFHRQLN